MLRNPHYNEGGSNYIAILNEVLSLNAQESSRPARPGHAIRPVLNEVLSLNAQESPMERGHRLENTILNEVLSLNAQESKLLNYLEPIGLSSMKS